MDYIPIAFNGIAMKSKTISTSASLEPNEDDIRDYAYHLYVQSGSLPGHDLENWLEAKACLNANIPQHRSRTRLHRHINQPRNGETFTRAPETSRFVS